MDFALPRLSAISAGLAKSCNDDTGIIGETPLPIKQSPIREQFKTNHHFAGSVFDHRFCVQQCDERNTRIHPRYSRRILHDHLRDCVRLLLSNTTILSITNAAVATRNKWTHLQILRILHCWNVVAISDQCHSNDCSYNSHILYIRILQGHQTVFSNRIRSRLDHIHVEFVRLPVDWFIWYWHRDGTTLFPDFSDFGRIFHQFAQFPICSLHFGVFLCERSNDDSILVWRHWHR